MSSTNGSTTTPKAEVPEEEHVDLGEQLDAAVRKAVAAAVATKAKAIAGKALTELLTDDVLAEMRATALQETRRTLRPDVHDEEDQEDEDKQLFYRTLPDFVEGYVATLYRREVTARGSEKSVRWCPRWWEHGEALARMEALWRAFEEARHGEGGEMSAWWIQHLDPHMDRVLDPEGPFKFCSVADGHQPKLPGLPVIPAPEGVFEDGHAHDEPTGVTASGIVLPPAGGSRRRVVMEFPE